MLNFQFVFDSPLTFVCLYEIFVMFSRSLAIEKKNNGYSFQLPLKRRHIFLEEGNSKALIKRFSGTGVIWRYIQANNTINCKIKYV